MPNLTDLPAEIIDNIADFILAREHAQYVGLDRKVEEPICGVSLEGGSASLCYFISRGSDLKSLASVSRYLRNVLFEIRFVQKVVVRDTYAWRQDRHAQALRGRIQELRLVVMPAQVRKYRGLPAILMKHLGIVKLELSWFDLYDRDLRLKALQAGPWKNDCDRSQPIILRNLIEFHLRLRSLRDDNYTFGSATLHVGLCKAIMQKIRAPALRFLHISSKPWWTFAMKNYSPTAGWSLLMDGIEAGNHEQLETIELCLEDEITSEKQRCTWKHMLNDLVQHFGSRLNPPKIVLRLSYKVEQDKHFDRLATGTLSLYKHCCVPTENDVMNFISNTAHMSSVGFALHIYGLHKMDRVELLSVKKPASRQTSDLRQRNDDENIRLIASGGPEVEYRLDQANMDSLYARI